MNATGVLLFGPSGSGKSTVTRALGKLGPYELVRPIKVGVGNTGEYRMMTMEALEAYRTSGRLLYAYSRYCNTYALDRTDVSTTIDHGGIPVAHAGRLEYVHAILTTPVQWVPVLLWCSRETAEKRLRDRAPLDPVRAERIASWDDALADIRSSQNGGPFDLAIRTDRASIDAIAATIDSFRGAVVTP